MVRFTVPEAPAARARVCLSSAILAPVAELIGATANDKFAWLVPAFVIWIDWLTGTVVTVPNETEAGFAAMVAWMAAPASSFPPPRAGMLTLFPESSLVTA